MNPLNLTRIDLCIICIPLQSLIPFMLDFFETTLVCKSSGACLYKLFHFFIVQTSSIFCKSCDKIETKYFWMLSHFIGPHEQHNFTSGV